MSNTIEFTPTNTAARESIAHVDECMLVLSGPFYDSARKCDLYRGNVYHCGEHVVERGGFEVREDAVEWLGGCVPVWCIEVHEGGVWTTDGVGDQNEFATKEGAKAAIPELARCQHCSESDYRVAVAS